MTPIVVVVMLTFLGLCGAFGGKPLADLSIYGFEDGKLASGEQPGWKIFQDKFLLGAWLIVSAILSGLIGGIIYVAVAVLIKTAQSEQWGSGVIQHAVPAVELVIGIPLLMWLPFLTIIILAGLVGHNLEDWVLELVARARARSLLLAGGALVISGRSRNGSADPGGVRKAESARVLDQARAAATTEPIAASRHRAPHARQTHAAAPERERTARW